MTQKLKVWLYCRIGLDHHTELLTLQEDILKGFVNENQMEIVGFTSELSSGTDFSSQEFQIMLEKMKNHFMDAILFYDQTRISIHDHLYVEFQLIAQKYEIFLIPLHILVDDKAA